MLQSMGVTALIASFLGSLNVKQINTKMTKASQFIQVSFFVWVAWSLLQLLLMSDLKIGRNYHSSKNPKIENTKKHSTQVRRHRNAWRNRWIITFNVKDKKIGPIPASFCLFLLFPQYNFNNTNWKKRRLCAWDSNLGSQDGRRRQNHRAMAATLM